MYERIDQASPFYGSEDQLMARAVELIEKSAALEGTVAPRTARSIGQLMLHANSYYSNLIEGQHTRPLEVEATLKNPSKTKNELVLLGMAHIKTEAAARARTEAGGNPYDAEFIKWLHGEFYSLLPDAMKIVRGPKGEQKVVNPGDWRKFDVEVGKHIAPRSDKLPHLMNEFVGLYRPSNNKAVSVMRIAAAHHRFVWIHPFLDGNGRVGRLLTHSWLRAAGIMGSGLWSISRGFARRKEEYLSRLQDADQARQGDLDGRGNLSLAALDAFCSFVLSCAVDQVEFMRANFRFETLDLRLQRAFAEFAISMPGMREEGWRLVREAVVHGEYERGEARRITGLGERVARQLVSDMLKQSLLASDSEKGKLYASFPVRAVSWYFPELFPPSDVIQYGDELE
jgi:Fic family protein